MQSLPPNRFRSLPQELLKAGIATKLNANDLASFRSTNQDFSTDADLKTAQDNARQTEQTSAIQTIFSKESTPAVITDLTEFKKNLGEAISNKSYTEMKEPIDALMNSLGTAFWENQAQLYKAGPNKNEQVEQVCCSNDNLLFVKFEMLRQACVSAEMASPLATPSLSKSVGEKIGSLFDPRGVGISLKWLDPVQNIATLFSSQPATMQSYIKEEQGKSIKAGESLSNDFPGNIAGYMEDRDGCVLF